MESKLRELADKIRAEAKHEDQVAAEHDALGRHSWGFKRTAEALRRYAFQVEALSSQPAPSGVSPIPPFGSQVEDFAGLDVTDEQAHKLVASAGEPAAQRNPNDICHKRDDGYECNEHFEHVGWHVARGSHGDALHCWPRATAAPASTPAIFTGVECGAEAQALGIIHRCKVDTGAHGPNHQCKRHLVDTCDFEWPAAPPATERGVREAALAEAADLAHRWSNGWRQRIADGMYQGQMLLAADIRRDEGRDIERGIRALAAAAQPTDKEASTEGQMLSAALAEVSAGKVRPLQEIKDALKYGYLPEDLDRAHGFLRGRGMPLNMEENEAMHRDLAIQFAEVRADEAKWVRSPEEAKARVAKLTVRPDKEAKAG